MKTILALVDFSEVSTNALSFAAELSKRTSARLILSHILQKPENEEDVIQKLKTIEADLKNSYDSELNCESFVANGNLIDTLKKIITARHPDLIVMGTKGASGLKKLLIGSNTVKVIANTDLPVLVIPELSRFDNFLRNGKNNIVLATDLNLLNNGNALDILKEIAQVIIEPKISVLSVRPKNTELTDMKKMERDFILSFFSPEIESERVTVFSSNVIRGIDYYLNKNLETGMVAMIARDSGTLIQKHYTREMASHTHLPLLVLHDAKS